MLPTWQDARPRKSSSQELTRNDKEPQISGKTKSNSRNTENRKLQNKIASKIYREKRKRKLQLLDDLIQPGRSSSTHSGLAPDGQSGSLGEFDPFSVPQSEAGGQFQGLVSNSPYPSLYPSLLEQSGDANIAGLNPGMVGQQAEESTPLFFYQNVDFSTQANFLNDFNIGPSTGTFGDATFVRVPNNGIVPSAAPFSSFSNFGVGTQNIPSGFSLAGSGLGELPQTGSVTPLSAFPPASGRSELYPPNQRDPSFSSMINRAPKSTATLWKQFSRLNDDQRTKLLELVRQRATGNVATTFSSVCTSEKRILMDRDGYQQSASTPRHESDRERLETDEMLFATFEPWLERIVPTKMPDVRPNNFTMRQDNYFAAIFANARVLGMNSEDLLLQESISSICKPYVEAGDQSSVERVRKAFSSVTKDLRPLPSQITVEHHPYIDVIPFKTFRERALVGISCDPPLLDEDELCGDFTDDGLICWGPQGQSSGMDAGVPWDIRSWEPQVWFLQKYWFLVGDKDDEMWSNARWWRSMRGERCDLDY